MPEYTSNKISKLFHYTGFNSKTMTFLFLSGSYVIVLTKTHSHKFSRYYLISPLYKGE